jgi:hypothetical protein
MARRGVTAPRSRSNALPARSPRALLIQPPVYDVALYDLFHQPFGLLRVGEWLRASGYEVKLLDCLEPRARTAAPGRGKFIRRVVEQPACLRGAGRRFARYGLPAEQLRERMRAARPDVILVTTGMTYWYPGVSEIGAAARETLPGVPLVAGGIYATLLPEHCGAALGTGHVVRGPVDGPTGLGPVLELLGLPRPSARVPGFPSVELRAASGRLCDAAAVRLNEGCPYRCAYCASRRLSPAFTRGQADGLSAHVRELHARYGMNTFAFYDDALLHEPERALVPFLEGVLREFGPRRLSFYLPNAVHMALLEPGILRLMHRAGFREIRLGLESVEPDFHDAADRKLDPADLARTVEIVRAAGFRGPEITAYIMLGLPGQPVSQVHTTLNRIGALGIGVSVSEYSPVPGSPLFAQAEELSGLDLREPLLHNNSVFATLAGFVTTDELRRIKERVRAIRRAMMA